jgi:hypothetical protein
MKNLFIIFILSLTIVSCKKKEEDSSSCSTCPVGGGMEPTGFSYNINGGGTTVADSATFNVANRTITSYKQGISKRIFIKTSSQLPGTYSFTSTANTFYYIESIGTYYATSGYITITANANNKMSGSFSTGGTGGTSTTVSGNFKDIPKR